MLYKQQKLIEALGKQECHVILDALHTFQSDQFNKGTLLKSEADIIEKLIPLFKEVAFYHTKKVVGQKTNNG